MSHLRLVRRENPAAEAEAAALVRLLGSGPLRGAEQALDGSYPERRVLDIADLVSHFEGTKTVAIATVAGKKSFALIFDLDRHFAARSRLIGDELRERRLDGATICTTGSDAGRGKVLVFFQKAQAQGTLRRLGREIIESASKRGYEWGTGDPKDVSIFPQDGAGGIVRVGGVNLKPSRHAAGLDVFFDLNGEIASFADVVPAKRFRADPEPISIAPVQSWVAKWRFEEPWRRDGDNYNRFLRMAAEARRVYGPLGIDILRQWANDVWDNSPDLRLASPSTGDKRSRRTFDRWRDNAWKRTVATREVNHYIAPGEGRDSDSSGAAFLRAISEWAHRKGLTPDAIGIGTRTLAAITGTSQPTAWRKTRRLEKLGRVVIIDPGIGRLLGKKAACMIIGLVGPGETPAEVRKRAESRGNVKQRRRLRETMAENAAKPEQAAPIYAKAVGL